MQHTDPPPPHGYAVSPVYLVVPGPPPRLVRPRRRGPIIGLVAAVVLCGGGAGTAAYLVTRAGSRAVNDLNKELNAVRTDVRVTGCALNRGALFATVVITWEVTNSGTRKRTYTPTFVVTGGDGTQLGKGAGFVTGLEPARTARRSTTVLVDKDVTGKVTCSLSA
jgi:hypothetical protein